jgi:anti-sigma factor RsiW
MGTDENRMDCGQAAVAWLLAADDELKPAERARMESHVTGCAACRAQRALFRQTDGRLLACGDLLDRQSPARSDARVPSPQRNWPAWQWAPVALAGIAFLAVVTWTSSRSRPQPPATGQWAGGNAEWIRMELPLSPIGDPFLDGSQSEPPILADLVVDEDGLPRGIRLAN